MIRAAPFPGRWWLLGLAVLTAPACGWRSGLAPPEVSAGATSVGIEIFGTDREEVLVRDLEPLLHDELSRATSDLVDAPLVSPRKADLVVRGRIVDYRRRQGIRRAGLRREDREPSLDPSQLGPAPFSKFDLLETGVRLVVSAELVHRRSGDVVRPTVTASVWSSYAVGPDEEARAVERALRNVADTLVLDLFAPEPGRGSDSEGDPALPDR